MHAECIPIKRDTSRSTTNDFSAYSISYIDYYAILGSLLDFSVLGSRRYAVGKGAAECSIEGICSIQSRWPLTGGPLLCFCGFLSTCTTFIYHCWNTWTERAFFTILNDVLELSLSLSILRHLDSR